MIKTICFFIVLSVAVPGYSAQASVEKNEFTADDYQITKTPKDWTQINIANKNEISLALQSKSKDSSFTLRTFKNPDPSLKKNAVSWLRDYKSYGFEILASKPVKLNNETYGYQIEALHKKSGKVFKQYMSIKNKKLLVLTCHSNEANKEFQMCSESLASFSWKANP